MAQRKKKIEKILKKKIERNTNTHVYKTIERQKQKKYTILYIYTDFHLHCVPPHSLRKI